jgi:SAM-dependent methyltransferase
MLIDDIDFARLYQQQLALAGRKEKPSAHWDARAEHIAIVDAPVIDSYLRQLLAKIDLHGASSLFDMGCGPGTVALALASQLNEICGVDYSQGMLDVAARRATAQGVRHAVWRQRSWEESWEGLPRCDIAVASRSTLVADMRDAMKSSIVRRDCGSTPLIWLTLGLPRRLSCACWDETARRCRTICMP